MHRITLLLLIFVSGNSMADWVKVTSHAEGNTYADPSTIIRDGNRVKMWTLVDYEKPKITAKQIKSFRSMKAQIEFDCKENLSRMISTFTYPENMGVGEAEDLSKARPRGFENSQKWTAIPPDTIGPSGSYFWKFACAN